MSASISSTRKFDCAITIAKLVAVVDFPACGCGLVIATIFWSVVASVNSKLVRSVLSCRVQLLNIQTAGSQLTKKRVHLRRTHMVLQRYLLGICAARYVRNLTFPISTWLLLEFTVKIVWIIMLFTIQFPAFWMESVQFLQSWNKSGIMFISMTC